jgi:hypothetical protein
MVNMNSHSNNKEVARFLQEIGVDTRFISIVDTSIHINNQRFSKFSNKRQETFIRNFPSFSITRSKIFQKICTRASRVLAKSLKPGEKIFILENDKCSSFILDVILEPYTRKYGINIIHGCDLEDAIKSEVDSIALPITLDNEVENILGNILNGEKIEVFSLKNSFGVEDNIKYIYPLLNVPRSWLGSWLEKLDHEYEYKTESSTAVDLIKFFEGFIPDVRENILKSAFYVVRECDYRK